MKKTALTFITGLLAICASAQTANDALIFSENNYEGSARTVAMGNAFTALGGDLGSIGLNPAGSAVAKYSQLTLTPALTFSASTTRGVSPYQNGDLPYFESSMKSRITNFNMPNLGITLNYDTHRTSGIKNMTIGFIVNQTANWNEDTYAVGTNGTTSFMGAMAYEADGLKDTQLGADNAFNTMPWKSVIGYNSYMISPFGGYDDQYVGASETIRDGIISLGGPIEQSYGRRVEGGKYDYIFNFGMNISDFIYIGANLGFTSMDYSFSEYFKEVAIDPANFEIPLDNGETIYFKDMIYRYSYRASGVGAYGKLGIIVTPGNGLRIGAAIQTPTVNNIFEEWQHDGEAAFDYGVENAQSPLGESSYSLTSPFRANFGLAYTLGRFGVVSADYEYCDYSQMKFRTDGYDRSYFEGINSDIKKAMGISHMLRVGAEVKPTPELAVRAGYGLTTSPEMKETANQLMALGIGYSDMAFNRQNVSFGLGYSSNKSFFADFAVRRAFIADEYYMPYADYIFDDDGYVSENGFAPEILNKRSLWKVLLTFGWRF